MIRQPVYALISLVLLLVVGWFVFDRLVFLQDAQRTTGKVVNVTAQNDRCGSRRSRYSCTRFHAHVEYRPASAAGAYRLNITAGSVRGHNQPVVRARLKAGAPVRVAYNPKKPGEAYEDTFIGIWGTPLMVLFGQIMTFIVSLTEPRRRRAF